jgi:site-specific recombinase XerD
VALSVVRDLREARQPPAAGDLRALEIDLLAGYVLARSSAGLADGTIRGEVSHLEQVRDWFARPLWEMLPSDADRYLGAELRGARPSTREGRASTLRSYFGFLEARHQAELHALTGIVVSCPIDDMNRPRGRKQARVRIPPPTERVVDLFRSWAGDLATCRKFAPNARNYAAARLMADVGLRANEVRMLDLSDVKWDLGKFGKLHVRHGKGARGSGPRERMVPLINGADRTLRWFVQDVWAHFDADHTHPGVPLFPSERRTNGSHAGRLGSDTLRAAVSAATEAHLPEWAGKISPHVLRHYCASQLYLNGMDLLAIQEMLGHSWVATTMRYVHVHREHIEQAWLAGQHRAALRMEGLI